VALRGGRMTRPVNPFRYFNSSPEVIRLVVMMYVKYPLSLRNVEDLHGQVHNHFNQERHLISREQYRERRSAALAEWRAVMA